MPFSPSLCSPGVDQFFEKPASEMTRGQRHSDVIGFDGFAKSYALVVGISDYDGFEDLPTGNDARRIATYFIDEAGFGFVHLLIEDKVTKIRLRSW